MKEILSPTIQQKPTLIHRSARGDFFKSGSLYLEDGMTFRGVVPRWVSGVYPGEVVFNTGMTGYVESLTDPSYSGQILVFTHPLIGNYGVQFEARESERIQVAGVVVSEVARYPSHARATQSLLDWLRIEGVSILSGVDTRALTKYLRSRGTMNGYIGTRRAAFVAPTARFVSIDKPIVYNGTARKTIVLVDCGMKGNILTSLLKFPMRVKRVPFDYDFTGERYDAVLLSNGPGDPTDYQKTVEIVRKAFARNVPTFGICLGSQIMALAAGAKTYKLPFGHRGHNQPCMELATKRCFITSQNHGYAIDERTLPKDWRVSFRNLNDQSVEGVAHASKPFFSVQFHPEACPGPTDTAWLFDTFFGSL